MDEFLKIALPLLGLFSAVGGIIAKFVTQGNKITHLEKDINKINADVTMLENKHDSLNKDIQDIKRDLEVLTTLNETTLKSVNKMLEKHDESIDLLKEHVAIHTTCKNFPGK